MVNLPSSVNLLMIKLFDMEKVLRFLQSDSLGLKNLYV